MVTEALGVMPGTVLVTYGDMPLLRSGTLAALTREHTAAGNAVTVLTARAGDPSGYGRIVRDERGDLAEIVEEADATPEQRAIEEINSGCYAFDGALLAGAVKRIAAGNAQGQEYLTDVVAILRGDGHPVGTVLAADPAEIQGVNDRVQLAAARRAYNSRLLEEWMRAGVTIVDPSATWIDVDVTLGQDAEVRPGTYLEGHTVIGPGARVGPGCVLRDTTVAPDATVQFAVCESAEIGSGASVGPFAFLRPGTRVGAGAHVGADVELKNASVGEGSTVGHLSYLGDADTASTPASARPRWWPAPARPPGITPRSGTRPWRPPGPAPLPPAARPPGHRQSMTSQTMTSQKMMRECRVRERDHAAGREEADARVRPGLPRTGR